MQFCYIFARCKILTSDNKVLKDILFYTNFIISKKILFGRY